MINYEYEFSNRVAECIFRAERLAAVKGSSAIEVEHLLFGLFDQDPLRSKGPNESKMELRSVRKLLSSKNNLSMIKRKVADLIPYQNTLGAWRKIPRSENANWIIDKAIKHSEEIGRRVVCLSDILFAIVLFGLTKNPESKAFNLLKGEGVNIDAIQKHIFTPGKFFG